MPSFGAYFTAVALAAFALVGWQLVRKRSAAAGNAILLAGLLLVIGCFTPPARTDTRASLSGTLTGDARIPVLAALDASARNATIENGTLVVSCPTRCDFAADSTSLATEGDLLRADVEGGPLRVTQQASVCTVEPYTLALLTGGTTCDACVSLRYEFAVGNGSRDASPVTGSC